MPKIPTTVKMSAETPEILNTIRANSSAYYQSIVPRVTSETDSPKEIGAIIMSYTALQNEFLTGLINRISRTILISRLYENPWSMFKKGLLDMGETVEEIFTNICSAQSFSPAVAENEVFKRVIPDVRTAFHTMNYQKFYKQTISDEQLRQAFLSWQGVTDLIASIVNSMYTAANYDEFLVMKYLIAKNAVNGNMYSVTIPAATTENAKSIVSTARSYSNKLTFMSTTYNPAGVSTFTPRDDQYILVNTDFDGIMNVEVLASAFNMSNAEFLGHMILVDGFGNLDIERLNALLGDTPGYQEIGSGDLTALNNIPAMLVDENFFMIFDNLAKFTEIYNSDGLYWNYSFHTWKTFSVSPFANAVIFNPVAAAVTGVTVSPSSVTVTKGQTAQFTANVTATGFAPQSVTWSVNGAADGTTISPSGLLTVDPAETKTPLTVTATSTYTPTKSGTATVTLQ